MRCSLRPPTVILLALVLAGCGGGSGDSSEPPPSPTATVVATPQPTATPVVVAAGALDPSFGTGGIVVVPSTGAVGAVRHSLRVLDDGGVELIALDRAATSTAVRVVRLLADGTRIDDEAVTVTSDAAYAAFGSTGDVWVLDGSDPSLRLSRFSRSQGIASEESSSLVALSGVADLVPLADGGMLAVGSRDSDAAGLQRFDARGIADATFGSGPPLPDGLALGPRRAGGVSIQFRTAVSGENGRILVAGTRFEGIAFNPAVLVYDAAGRLAAFGHRGSANLGTIGSGVVIAAAPDGGAVVGIDLGGLARIDSRGARDPDYSARVDDPNSPVRFYAFTLAANGDLTGVGTTSSGDAPVVYRLRPDGTGDARFGGTGLVVTRFDVDQAQSAAYYAFAALPAGRITATGTACRQPDACDLVVARYGGVAS